MVSLSRKIEWMVSFFLIGLTAAVFLSAATGTPLPKPAAIAPPDPFVVETVYYEVEGRSPREVRTSLSQRGPQDAVTGNRFDAFVRWTVDWDYICESGRLKEIAATGKATITLPRWIETSAAAAGLKDEWATYIEALSVHENGHVAHGQGARQEVNQLLEGFKGSCNGKRSGEADTLAGQIISKWAKKDAAYDRETGHGATQGAVFPSRRSSDAA